ncbi:hypothetical protein [Rathayibacter sp. AY2B5]|uniref:hypothetical protein n=1 Tax=Rathayibacter sp. AY2B5 TaxID=2080570 RepID=UPI000CE92B20|nr:hypothetical protein [Rathayibacter sp. AY2B5]PPG44345.1 hypothetical protein C5C30_02180 [Rathayibacter sp. AY2B5]
MAETTYNGMAFRAKPYGERDDDGLITWLVEYKQAPKLDWGPRGAFYERDGVFLVHGREYPDAVSALWQHAHFSWHPPR